MADPLRFLGWKFPPRLGRGLHRARNWIRVLYVTAPIALGVTAMFAPQFAERWEDPLLGVLMACGTLFVSDVYLHKLTLLARFWRWLTGEK